MAPPGSTLPPAPVPVELVVIDPVVAPVEAAAPPVPAADPPTPVEVAALPPEPDDVVAPPPHPIELMTTTLAAKRSEGSSGIRISEW
jgi:hypothetical protein